MSHTTLLDQIKTIIAQSKDWASLELEYAKLTAAEKITILAGMACTGLVCLMLGMTALILFGFSLAHLFSSFMNPALGYLSAGGLILLIIVAVYLLRTQLILNPIARILTKILLK